jgi:hypothetical protein
MEGAVRAALGEEGAIRRDVGPVAEAIADVARGLAQRVRRAEDELTAGATFDEDPSGRESEAR